MTARDTEIEELTVEIIRMLLKPKRVYLFGSRAKKSNKQNSDFDFAVDVKNIRSDKKVKLKEEIK